MATTTPNFGWSVPTSTDYVKDGALAIETLGDAIDASLVDLKGGASGYILSKNSASDMDFAWIPNALPATPAGINKILNGDFGIWQRGTSFANVANFTYFSDRWRQHHAGTGTAPTCSQDTSVPTKQFKFSAKTTQVGTAATSVTAYMTRQFIENSMILPLLGNAATLSFWYRSNKTGNHGVRVYGAYNTGGTDQSTTFNVPVADTWQMVTLAITAFAGVSTVSAALDAPGALVDIGFRVENNGFTSLSASDYYQITGVQLEAGSVATPFSTATGNPASELAACQRYYVRFGATSNVYGRIGSGIVTTTTAVQAFIALPTQMRVPPTSVEYSTIAAINNTVYAITGATLNNSSFTTGGVEFQITGGTVNQPVYIAQNNSTSGYLGFSAEL